MTERSETQALIEEARAFIEENHDGGGDEGVFALLGRLVDALAASEARGERLAEAVTAFGALADAFDGDAAFESMLMPEQIERELGDRRRRSLAKADLILARPPDWTDEEVERAARAHWDSRYGAGAPGTIAWDQLSTRMQSEGCHRMRASLQSLRTPAKAGGWSAGQIERAWRSRHAFMTSGATSEMGWEDGERAGMAVALDSISGPPPTVAETEEKAT